MHKNIFEYIDNKNIFENLGQKFQGKKNFTKTKHRKGESLNCS